MNTKSYFAKKLFPRCFMPVKMGFKDNSLAGSALFDVFDGVI